MNLRLRLVLTGVAVVGFGLLIALHLRPESSQLEVRPPRVDSSPEVRVLAVYATLLCCAAFYRRGLLWVLGIVVSGIGTLIFLITAIARPDETISWLYAATYAIEGLALLALGLTARQERDLAAGVAVGDSGVAHAPKETLVDDPTEGVQGSEV